MRKFIGPFMVGIGITMMICSLMFLAITESYTDKMFEVNETFRQREESISSKLEDMNKKIEELSNQLPK